MNLELQAQEKVALDEDGKRHDDNDNMVHVAIRRDTAKRESQHEQVGGSAAGGVAGAGSSCAGHSFSRGHGGNGRRGGRRFSPAGRLEGAVIAGDCSHRQ